MDFQQSLKSSIGRLLISASEKGITSIKLISEVVHINDNPNGFTRQAKEELIQYFDGKLTAFTVSLDWTGYSEFYQSVWQYLLNIPFGQTRSYLDISKYLDNPGASRAVGLANGKNPIPIIVPCHRVIGSNGSLTGFALGLPIKQHLLNLENPKSFAIQSELF